MRLYRETPVVEGLEWQGTYEIPAVGGGDSQMLSLVPFRTLVATNAAMRVTVRM